MNELRNIRPSLISLVGKAANKTTVIYKSSPTADAPQLRTFEIISKDAEKRLVYGLVYSPNDEDTQGDFATAEEIEKAAHSFMQTLETTAKVDTQHNLQPAPGVHIVQSYIVNKGDEMYPDREGSWAIVVKVDNDEVWGQVKDGTLTGFSMFGTAERITETEDSTDGNLTKEETSLMKGLFKTLNKIFKNKSGDNTNMKKTTDRQQVIKDFNAMINAQDVRDYIWMLSDSFNQIYNDETIADKKAAIMTNIDQFRAKVDSVLAGQEIMKSSEAMRQEAEGMSDIDFAKIEAGFEAYKQIIEISKLKTNKPVDEKIQKQIDDAVAAAVEATKAEIKKESDAKITELTGTIETLTKENEELKKETPGSQQEPTDPVSKADTSGDINYLGFRS